MATSTLPTCTLQDHAATRTVVVSAEATERCARIFRALGEAPRLRLVSRLMAGPACVSELAAAEGESITTISQRLRILRSENVVERRRQGKHLLYSLVDEHMFQLVFNGLAHATEHSATPSPSMSYLPKGTIMTNTEQHIVHENHPHQHGTDCGHTAIEHNGHTDYLHNGHMHHPHDGHVDEHTLDVTAANPASCTEGHDCDGHDATHKHGADCGHEAVPHGDHVDYLVDGHLHHPHEGHCDNHGAVTITQ